jgi:hypothetical protein
VPRKSDLLSINNEILDQRVKLTAAEKIEILSIKEQRPQRTIATLYGVSRRTIQFIWFPEKLMENKLRRAERGGTAQYYDRESNNVSQKKHRDYKKELHLKGLI